MDKKLYQIAADCCSDVYKRHTNLGTTEYQCMVKHYNGEPLQVLSIAGTNEIGDWGKNVNLWSKKGIKKSAYEAAKELEFFGRIPEIPLLVCGHSKGGAEAIAFKRLFGANYCVAFAPARCLRYWSNRAMENTTIFIDPDDPVSGLLGRLSFGLPKCKTIVGADDHFGYKIKDHFMSKWIEFVGGM